MKKFTISCIQGYLFIFICSNYFFCSVFQPIANSTEKIVRRGSCIAFELPPITFTSSQTAVERQLIGEEIQIETNGWLLASSKTSFDPPPTSFSTVEDSHLKTERRYQIEMGVIEYYQENIKEYLRLHIIGEGYKGYLIEIPYSLNFKKEYIERNIAIKTAQEVNRARFWIYEYLRNTNKVEEAKIFIHSFYLEAKKRKDEWFFTEEGKWEHVI